MHAGVVRSVAIFADELDQFCVGENALIQLYGPRLRICPGIVNSDFDFQIAEVWPSETLDESFAKFDAYPC